jgi:hypothetical protein
MAALEGKADVGISHVRHEFMSARPNTTLADLAIELRDRIHKSVFQ